jgi:Autotransporter beta-domain
VARLYRGGMKEKGAGLYDLSNRENTNTSLKPMMGIDVARSYKVDADITLTPEIYGIYRYEVMDASERADTLLDGIDGAALNSTTTRLSRHSMQVGSNLGLKIGERLTSKVQFDADLQPSSHSYRGLFKLSYVW